MLELRPNCECCDRDLPPDSADARICSFECTFCSSCSEGTLKGICPNCGRRADRASHPAGGHVGKISGVGEEDSQARRLCSNAVISSGVSLSESLDRMQRGR